VVVEGGSLSSTGADFSGSVGGGRGGIIQSNGGAIDLKGGSVHFTDASSQDGNAIFATGDAAHITATDVNMQSDGTGSKSADPSSAVYAARGARIDLSGGTAKATGRFGFALQTTEGGQITADGTTLTTTGPDGTAAYVYANGTPSSIILTDVEMTAKGDGARGIDAAHDGALIEARGFTLDVEGEDGYGVVSRSGATVHLQNGTLSTTDATGIEAYDGSTVTGDNLSLITEGDYTEGLSVGADSRVELTGTDIQTNGLWSHGAHAADDGAQIILRGGSVVTANDKGKGTQDGDGSRAYALYADHAGATIATDGTTIETVGQRAYGAYAKDGGAISLDGGSISTQGFMAYGVYASGEGSKIAANNLDITTTGQVGDAAWAYAGGQLTLTGGTYHVTGGPNSGPSGETANGLVALGGTDEVAAGVIDAEGVSVLTEGADSAGLLLGAEIGVGGPKTSGEISIKDSMVVVRGEGSDAARVNYGSRLSAEGSTLRSELGAGIVLQDNATVSLTGTTVEAKQESIRSLFTQAGQMQDISVGDGSVITKNDGTLLKVSRTETGADGQVVLTLEKGSTTRGDIIDLDSKSGNGSLSVYLREGADWSGIMKGVDNYTASPGGKSEFEDGSEIKGDLGGDDSDFVFKGEATVGGNVTGKGSSFKFGGGATVDGDVSGENSSFAFSKTEQTILHGNATFTGGSQTSGGSVEKPIAVSGNVAVDDQSFFGGNWSIGGNLSVGGTVSPGNSIGVVSVGGDHSFGDQAVYKVEVDANGQSDRMVIGGVASLDGMVNVVPLDGLADFRIGSAYTIVTADGGFAADHNRFDGVSWDENRLFVAPMLGYSDTAVTLTIDRNDVSFASVAETDNQTASAQALDSLGLGNKAHDAVSFATAADARQAFDALSGEIHAGLRGALVTESTYLRDAVTERVRQADHDANERTVAGTTVAMWGRTFGSWGHFSGDGNAARLSRDTGGFMAAADGALSDSWRLGFAMGFSHSSLSEAARLSSADVDSYHLSLYGGGDVGPLGLRLGVSRSWHRVDTSRTAEFAGFSDHMAASYNARTAQAFADVGYAVTDNGLTVEPFGSAAYVRLNVDGFLEQGGDAALRAEDAGDDYGFSLFGIRTSTALNLNAHRMVTLKAMAGWRHTYGDVTPDAALAFADGGSAFDVAGSPIARDALAIQAGVDAQLSRTLTLGIAYRGDVADEVQDHGFTANLSLMF